VRFGDYLAAEWRPALGCTEPASIAFAASSAAAQASGAVTRVELRCDPRIYKNCYAVGIPYSGHKVGIRWALAIGSLLPDPGAGLECFRQISPAILAAAGELVARGQIAVEVDRGQRRLLVDCRVVRGGVATRAVIEGEHTRLVALEREGKPLPLAAEEAARPERAPIREELARRSFAELRELARGLAIADRLELRRGAALNLAIAQHGLALFPERFVKLAASEPLTRVSQLVCAGVYARMWGEDLTVMSLAGSGNKGIVTSVPLTLWGRERGVGEEQIDEALALACLVTSATTHHLGPLSAVCGCSNAAGIGAAAGLVALEGGGGDEISLAVNNMVGNVTGMVCDGAKIGCALKTMTSVDAAFRAASLAMSGIGIPVSDGIVGEDGMASLANLGRLAARGMVAVDDEILQIMQEKMG
jgi:L-cysteine desulfidase